MIDLNFIDCQIPKFLLATSHFEGHSLIKWTIVESKTDFGFMSSIYEAKLITTTDGEKYVCLNICRYHIIMKDDVSVIIATI